MSLKKAKDLGIDTFYKVLNNDLCHYGYKYHLGINEDILPFNPKGKCESGGLFFVVKEILHEIFNEYKNRKIIATITLDSEEDVWVEDDKFKSHKINVIKIQTIGQFLNEQTEDILISIIGHNISLFKYIKVQTPKICMKVVKYNWRALQYVKEQTPEICIEAVKQNGSALQYVKDQILEICIEAFTPLKI